MKLRIIKYLMFIFIPVLSVIICLSFRLAQGEIIEELVGGIIIGLILDLVYFIILLLVKKISTSIKRPN